MVSASVYPPSGTIPSYLLTIIGKLRQQADLTQLSFCERCLKQLFGRYNLDYLDIERRFHEYKYLIVFKDSDPVVFVYFHIQKFDYLHVAVIDQAFSLIDIHQERTVARVLDSTFAREYPRFILIALTEKIYSGDVALSSILAWNSHS